jgi:hypothetical protein
MTRISGHREADAPPAQETAGEQLIPVMTRLGPDDLATVDTLITAGIASSRADALRWALARIREHAAYAQLHVRGVTCCGSGLGGWRRPWPTSRAN